MSAYCRFRDARRHRALALLEIFFYGPTRNRSASYYKHLWVLFYHELWGRFMIMGVSAFSFQGKIWKHLFLKKV
jgi:hypothetical protein